MELMYAFFWLRYNGPLTRGLRVIVSRRYSTASLGGS